MQDFLKVVEVVGVCFIFVDVDCLCGIVGIDCYQGVVVKVELLLLVFNFDELFDGIEGMLLLLVFDGVMDLYNFGVCLCVVDVVGVYVVIVLKDCSVGINMMVVKVVSGVVEIVLYIIVINLVCMLCELQECGVWVIGMVDEVEQDFYQVDFKGFIVIVMGVEGEGMCCFMCEMCDVLVSILMVGSVESLNVLVVSGVCLFEVVCQCVVVFVKK